MNNLTPIPFNISKPDKSLNMCIINCQSVRNKAGLILDYIQDHHFDIVATTDNWFRYCNRDEKGKGDITPIGYRLR